MNRGDVVEEILWIEDEVDFIKTIVEFLNEFFNGRYEVVVKSTVDDSLAYIIKKKRTIALIILDSIMRFGSDFTPEERKLGNEGNTTGLVVLSRLKKIAPNIPVLLSTVLSQQEIGENIVQDTQVVDQITKPLSLTQVANKVIGILGVKEHHK